ncbi:hypothetical protein F5883DRAFT_253109 [Diaporthe sp. PMI_573]|nr:hypothetical protein F5883DRAFT_253109 [Diaporthaceae sp. PMI_573]
MLPVGSLIPSEGPGDNMGFHKAVSEDDYLARPGFEVNISALSPAPSELSKDSCCRNFGNSSTSCSAGKVSRPTLHHLTPHKCKLRKDEDHLEVPACQSGPHNSSKTTARRAIGGCYPPKLCNEFSALQDSIPSLQGSTTKGQEENHPEHLQELRATILREAELYISHLEERNLALQTEHTTLEVRVAAYEKLFGLCANSCGLYTP